MVYCNSHPDDSTIKKVSTGRADRTQTLMLEAHVHYCQVCQEKYRFFQDQLLEKHLPEQDDHIQEPRSVLASINLRIDALSQNQAATSEPTDKYWDFLPPEVYDEFFKVSKRKWNTFWPAKGKVTLLSLDLGSPYELFLARMDPGAVLPGHSHLYSEQTLVLKGQYIVQHKTFEKGDWTEAEVGQVHHPRSGDKEPCYCLIRSHKKGFTFVGNSRWRNPFLNLLKA